MCHDNEMICLILSSWWTLSVTSSRKLLNRLFFFFFLYHYISAQIALRDAQQRFFTDCRWHSHVLSLSIISAQSDPTSVHSPASVPVVCVVILSEYRPIMQRRIEYAVSAYVGRNVLRIIRYYVLVLRHALSIQAVLTIPAR